MTSPTVDGAKAYVRRGSRLATLITYVLSPPALPPILMWIVLCRVGADAGEKAILVAGSAVLLSLMPTAFLVWLVRSGREKSLILESRRHRNEALAVAVGGGLLLIVLVLLVSSQATSLLLAIAASFLITVGLLMFVNRSWRISLHAAAAAAFLSVVLFLVTTYPQPSSPSVSGLAELIGAAVAVSLVAWSRLRLGAHSVAQVVAGTVLGLGVPYLVLTGLAVVLSP